MSSVALADVVITNVHSQVMAMNSMSVYWNVGCRVVWRPLNTVEL